MKTIKNKKVNYINAGVLILLVLVCVFSIPLAAKAAKKQKLVMNKSEIVLTRGEKLSLRLKRKQQSMTYKKLVYKINDKSVAKVNSKGVVTAVNEGKTNIKVYARKAKGIKCKVKVTVINLPEAVTPVMDIKQPDNTATPPVLDVHQEVTVAQMYQNLIFDNFSLNITSGNQEMIALDMKSCTSLSDSEKEALRSAINEKYNITTVIKTKEELINESLIEKDDTFGTVFTKGTLITIEEKDVGNDTFNFNISIFKTGLSMKGYRECVAKKQSGSWSCEIGYTVIS